MEVSFKCVLYSLKPLRILNLRKPYSYSPRMINEEDGTNKEDLQGLYDYGMNLDKISIF